MLFLVVCWWSLLLIHCSLLVVVCYGRVLCFVVCCVLCYGCFMVFYGCLWFVVLWLFYDCFMVVLWFVVLLFYV